MVTGDSGIMLAPLLKAGISKSKIHHEQEATSTVENATFTDPILTKLGAKKVVLVTNWFHAPRSLAVFRRHQPGREFAAAFEPKPDKMSNWHRYASRRERLAALSIWSRQDLVILAAARQLIRLWRKFELLVRVKVGHCVAVLCSWFLVLCSIDNISC